VIARVVETPALARAVARLPAETLHRVVERYGLEASIPLLALTSASQRQAFFDLDLWRSAAAGADEQLDPDRFAEWLEQLVEHDPQIAARHLAEMEPDLAVAALSAHLRVYDAGASAPYQTLEGEWLGRRIEDEASHASIGGYVVVPGPAAPWDALTVALAAFAEIAPRRFHRVMRGCRALTNRGYEVDALDDLSDAAAQVRYDAARRREQRRAGHGYIDPAEARAFLQLARAFDLNGAPPASRDPVSAGYFRALARHEHAEPGRAALPGGPAQQERADAPDHPVDRPRDQDEDDDLDQEDARTLAQLLEPLQEPGPAAPAAGLLADPAAGAPRFGRIREYLLRPRDPDPDGPGSSEAELAFLANVLVAGASVQGRPFTAREASDAVLATCNLGLEVWPAGWSDGSADAIRLFQAGWATLYRGVSLHACASLLDAITGLRCSDRATEAGLDELRACVRAQIRSGTPWRVHDALDVLATFDLPAWAALLGLFGECPVLLANVWSPGSSPARTLSPSEFVFVSEVSQIRAVHRFMAALPELLTG
jgi:hypothetical protein